MESKDLNVVETEALDETNIYESQNNNNTSSSVAPKDDPQETEDPIDPRWVEAANRIKSGNANLIEPADKRVYDEAINIDLSKYTDELGPNIFLPEGGKGLEILNQNRADAQAWYTQAGNMLGQAAIGEIFGGTIEGLGYVLDIGSIVDLIQGDEKDFGNFMTEFGQSLREGAQEYMPIYEDPSATGFGKALDTGWWASGLVSTASTLSMLLPTMAVMRGLSFVGKGIAASRGMMAARKAAGLAAKMGRKGKWMTNGISQAILSRNIENWMEAHGTFEDMKSQKMNEINKKTGKLFTAEEATEIASEAARGNYGKGWAMLLQDIPQYLAIGKIFNPISGKFVKATDDAMAMGVKSSLKPWQSKLSAAAQTFFGEAGEESYQYLISEQSKLKADLDAGQITQEEYDKAISEAIGSEEMIESAFFGGLGGNLFKAIGSASDSLFKSKTQKEYEKGLEETYSHHIKNRANALRLSYQHLNSADQSDSKELRDHIINESMLNLAVESLENNKFNQFYETLGMVSEMSEEDAESYKKQTGEEFSRELAKESAPKLQEMALRVRDKYLKHRNHYNSSTSSKLTMLEMHNEKWSKNVEKSRDNVSEIKSEMESQFDMQPTDRLKNKLNLLERGKVLKKRKKHLEKRLKKTTDSKKPFVQKAIDNNEALLEQHKKDDQKQKEETKNRTPQQKEIDERDIVVNQDKAAEELYNSLHRKSILRELNNEARAREQIIINNEDMAFTKSQEGERMRKEGKIRDKIDSMGKNPDKDKAIEDLTELREIVVPESEILDDDKNQLYRIIDAKINELKEKQEELQEASEDDLADIQAGLENEQNNQDPQTPTNVDTLDPDPNYIEDHQADETINATDDQKKATLKANNKKRRKNKMVAILDRIEDKNKESVIKDFDEWLLRPNKKVGETFSYIADVKNTTSNQGAIKAFKELKKKGFKKGDKIPQEILDFLPIKVSLDKNKKVFSYIRTKPTKATSESLEVLLQKYEIEYAEERKVIITKLLSGEKASSNVVFATGGELQVDYDTENQVVPEYSILDLEQFGGDISKIKLLVTDKHGRLMDMNKVQDTELGGKQFLLSHTKNSSRLPYKGGLFLKVKMANGEPFALKLNHKRLTTDQAEVLADLLMEVGVTSVDKDKDGKVIKGKKGKTKVSKKLNLSSTLDAVEDGLQARIKDVLGPEVNMLDPKYQEPTIQEIIDAFVYMSSETIRKTSALFMDKNDLVFGSKSKKITMANRNNPETRKAFIKFLTTKKRRQFNVDMFQNQPGYREFIINNAIINTDATISGPLFKNTRRRSDERGDMQGIRAQIYLKPLRKLENEGVTLTPKGEVLLSNKGPKEPKKKKISDSKVILKEEKFSVFDGLMQTTEVTTIATYLDGSLGAATVERFDSDGEREDVLRNQKMIMNGKPVKKGVSPEKVIKSRLNDGDVFKKIGEKSGSEANTANVLSQLTAKQKSQMGISTLDTSPEKGDVESESSNDKTVNYTPRNGVEETFTIRGNKVFNSEGVEVFKGKNIDKNKIFANLSVKKNKSKVVDYLGKKYVVNDNKKIMAVSSGEILRFEEGDEHEENILDRAESAGLVFANDRPVAQSSSDKIKALKKELDNLDLNPFGQKDIFVKNNDRKIQIEKEIKNLEGKTAQTVETITQQESRGREVAEGIKIIDNALTSSEELEIFEMIKPFIESQGSRSNKGKNAPIMIGMGLRWDYKSNNPGRLPVEIKETIVNTKGQRNKYAYYDVSIDGESLGEIPARLKELMTKATGIDASNYDGAIINVYPKNGFISAHNDVDESVTAINYPVIVANIGGAGSLSVEGAKSQKAKKGYSSKEYVDSPLSSGSAYIFGEDGKNRNVFHRTLPSPGKGNLPQLNVNGQIIPANSYRISVTLRRVKDLEPGMLSAPNKKTQPTPQTSEVKVSEKDLSFKKGKLETFTLYNKEEVKGTAIIIKGQPSVKLFVHKIKGGWQVVDNNSKKSFPLSLFLKGIAGTKAEVLGALHRDITKYSKEGASKEVLKSIGFNFGKLTPQPSEVNLPKVSKEIPFSYGNNKELILNGDKTITSRNSKFIPNLKPGESGIQTIDGADFKVTYHGNLKHSEVKNKVGVEYSEGEAFAKTTKGAPTEKATVDFIKGKGTKHIYQLSRIQPTQQTSGVESISAYASREEVAGEYGDPYIKEVSLESPKNTEEYVSYRVKENEGGRKYLTNLSKNIPLKFSTWKGAGYAAYVDFINTNKIDEITTDTELTQDGINVLERLEKNGLVVKTDAKVIKKDKTGKGEIKYIYNKPLYEFTSKPTQQAGKAEEGVSDLFKSNPKLENEVYEVLGFDINKLSYKERAKKYKKAGIRKSDGTKITEQDIEQNPTFYQNNTGQSTEKYIASEKTIRDLAERMADRIGLKVRYESDRTKNYKGKLEKGGSTAVINLAYATLDTPIHEILGHPMVRAIKNIGNSSEDIDAYNTIMADYWDDNPSKSREEVIAYMTKNHPIRENKLYQNLVKELESGKGKEVFDRIKKDYTLKEFPITDMPFGKPYEYRNERFDTYDEALKYKNDNQEFYTLEEQQEEAIVELLGLYTANKLNNVKDGSLISLLKRFLKEIKSYMKSLFNAKEIEIDKLPDNMNLGDIADLLAYSNSKLILPGNEVIYTTPDNNKFKTYKEASKHVSELIKLNEIDLDKLKIDLTNKELTKEDKLKAARSYFQYQDEDLKYDLLFSASAYFNKEQPDDASLEEIAEYLVEKEFGRVLSYSLQPSPSSQFIIGNKEYEKSKEIIEEWKKVNDIKYDPEEVYSRGQGFYSVVGAYSSFNVDLMFQNLLSHIEDNKKAGGAFTVSAFTKPVDKKIGHLEGGGGKIKFKIFPQSNDIKWAADADAYSGSVWNASETVNKDKDSEIIGVSYTKSPSLVNLEKVQPNLADVIDKLQHHHNELGVELTGKNFRLEYDDDVPYSTKKLLNSINSILDNKFGKLNEPNIKKQVRGAGKIGKKPTQTKENTKSINTIQKKYSTDTRLRENAITDISKVPLMFEAETTGGDNTVISFDDGVWEAVKLGSLASKYLNDDQVIKAYNKTLGNTYIKQYDSQATTNIKIAALKEGQRKFPRSLIRSEVVPYKSTDVVDDKADLFDELPFQLVGDKDLTPKQRLEKTLKKQQALKMFQQYVDATGKKDIEGFRKFVNRTGKQAQQITANKSFNLNGKTINVKPNHHPEIESIIKKISGNPTGLRKVESKDPDNKTRYYVDNNNNRFIGMSSVVNPSDFNKKGKNEPEADYKKRMEMWSGAAPIGQAVDDVLRSFFDGETPVYTEEVAERLSKDAFKDLIKQAKKFKKDKENVFGKDNVEFLTKGLFISDKTIVANKKEVNQAVTLKKDRKFNYGIATEMDMVIVDKRTGVSHLVDFKTQRTEVNENTLKKLTTKYTSKTDPNVSKSKVDGYSKQQNASRLIFKKQTGLDFETISLMVVATRYNRFGQKTSTANLKQEVVELNKEEIEDVFPKSYRKQILGEVTESNDILDNNNNQDNLSSSSGSSISPGHMEFDEDDIFDLDKEPNSSHSYDDNDQVDLGQGRPTDSVRNSGDGKVKYECKQ